LSRAADTLPAGEFKRMKAAALAAAVAAAACTLYLFEPGSCGLFPPCPFHALTGFYCPGCGSTRALHQLMHGNLSAALGLNPLMVMALPFMLYALVSYLGESLISRPLPRLFIPSPLIWALLVIIVLYGAARNIPYCPFIPAAP